MLKFDRSNSENQVYLYIIKLFFYLVERLPCSLSNTKMRVSVFILFLNSIIIAPVLAHNLYNITPQNNNENSPRNIPTITYTFNTSFAQQFVAHFDLNQPNSYPFQDLSDAAVYLTQLGETEKALDILQWLHQQHPQEYKIAANLGATHELKET